MKYLLAFLDEFRELPAELAAVFIMTPVFIVAMIVLTIAHALGFYQIPTPQKIPRAIPVQRKPVTSEGVGEWTGEASKGFAKGFVKGLMKKKEDGNEQANN